MGRRGVRRGYGVLAWGLTLLPMAAEAQRPRFIAGAPIAIAAGDVGPQALALADLDRNGRLDIVVISGEEDGGPIALLMNQGAGAFAAPRFVGDANATLGNPVAIAVADVGSAGGGPDQHDDLIVVDHDGGYLVLLGDGSGHFAIDSELIEADRLDSPMGVAVADFDGQSGLDLAVIDEEGSGGNGEIHFLCNTGQSGVFTPCISAMLDSGGEAPIDVAAGDFNADGRMDAIVLNRGDDVGEGNVAAFIGQGDGRFSLPAQRTFSVANEPRDFVVAHLNPADDAIADVAIAEFEFLSDDNVTILFGATGGSMFRQRGRALIELGATAIAAGSFSNSADPDLAGGNDSRQGVTSVLSIAVGDGTGLFQDPQIGSLLPGGTLALVAGRLNDDDLDDVVALNITGTALRIALNVFDPSTHTPTTTVTPPSSRTPTRASPPPASATATVTLVPSPTGVSSPTGTTTMPRPPLTATPIAGDDDSCSIAAGGTRSDRGSWWPLAVGVLGMWLRRRTSRG